LIIAFVIGVFIGTSMNAISDIIVGMVPDIFNEHKLQE
jgi:hypothetical protein